MYLTVFSFFFLLQHLINIFFYGNCLAKFWEADILQRTGVAGFTIFYPWRILSRIILMHLTEHILHFLTELLCNFYALPPSGLAVKNCAFRYLCGKHFL